MGREGNLAVSAESRHRSSEVHHGHAGGQRRKRRRVARLSPSGHSIVDVFHLGAGSTVLGHLAREVWLGDDTGKRGGRGVRIGFETWLSLLDSKWMHLLLPLQLLLLLLLLWLRGLRWKSHWLTGRGRGGEL